MRQPIQNIKLKTEPIGEGVDTRPFAVAPSIASSSSVLDQGLLEHVEAGLEDTLLHKSSDENGITNEDTS